MSVEMTRLLSAKGYLRFAAFLENAPVDPRATPIATPMASPNAMLPSATPNAVPTPHPMANAVPMFLLPLVAFMLALCFPLPC